MKTALAPTPAEQPTIIAPKDQTSHKLLFEFHLALYPVPKGPESSKFAVCGLSPPPGPAFPPGLRCSLHARHEHLLRSRLPRATVTQRPRFPRFPPIKPWKCQEGLLSQDMTSLLGLRPELHPCAQLHINPILKGFAKFRKNRWGSWKGARPRVQEWEEGQVREVRELAARYRAETFRGPQDSQGILGPGACEG